MKKILLLITSAGFLMACDSFKVKNATTTNITVDDETVEPGHCVEVSDGFLFGSWPPSVRDTDDGTPHEAKEITGDARHVAVTGFDENGTPQVEALQNPEVEATCRAPATPTGDEDGADDEGGADDEDGADDVIASAEVTALTAATVTLTDATTALTTATATLTAAITEADDATAVIAVDAAVTAVDAAVTAVDAAVTAVPASDTSQAATEAKTAAETAKTAAETAKAAAETAKTNAGDNNNT